MASGNRKDPDAATVDDIGASIAGAGHAALPSDGPYEVDEFNDSYAIVLVGSRCMILREFPEGAPHERLQLLSLEAFHAWNANRVEYLENSKKELKAVPKSTLWMRDPARRQYSGIVFEPDPDGPDAAAPAGTYNLWRGFEYERSRDGDNSAILDHLLERVCQGSEELFHYVTAWFAHMVQRPRERIGTALVIRGGQGTGKTMIGQTFGSLFAPHYFLADDPRYLIGQFNAHMKGCLLLQADEGFWAGDKHAEGRLKGLVTSDIQFIEHKGVDPIQIKNYVRLLVTSNEDWVVPAGKDERRFAVFDIKDKGKGDGAYFSSLFAEAMRPENRAALLDYLLDFDLSRVDLRDIPKTGGLFEQKVRSLDPIESWWLERLREGAQLPGTDEWKDWVPTYRLHASYIAFAERVGIKRRATETEFGIKLKKLVPGIVRKKRVFLDDDGKQIRPWGYDFPPLLTARAWFEASVGQDVTWDEESEEASP
ncbi:DUF5906 domain-containing protein [Amorphus orientalis]|uniref:NrS-1 polymerase-like helicase domain-containing protein n=1 Tax=Amorphus orientalis TaxID=649198 RepID=A0AAE3VMM5_9HYPH|nr:DUF5906 domain-containing protein [Amorphus orientalis]MDQ0314836.1 hypothetical protein [Amorphus orientalis]